MCLHRGANIRAVRSHEGHQQLSSHTLGHRHLLQSACLWVSMLLDQDHNTDMSVVFTLFLSVSAHLVVIGKWGFHVLIG